MGNMETKKQGNAAEDSIMKKYNERLERVTTAFAGGTPDRVPFIPRITGFYARGYGIHQYELMKDLRTAEKGIRGFLTDYEPDLAWPIVVYNMDLVETLGADYIKVPGPLSGLDLDASFQFHDRTYLEDDEFGEFLKDPTYFIITKLLPRKNKNLAGLSKIYLREFYEHMANMELSAFAQEDVLKSAKALVRAGEIAQKQKEQIVYLSRIYKEMGFPTRGGMMVAPFDCYADSIRGYLQAAMDT